MLRNGILDSFAFLDDLGELGTLGGLVDHRVRVLDTDSIGARLRLQERHEIVVMLAVLPVALPLEQGRDRGHTDGTSLNHARESRLVSRLTSGATAIFHDVDIVALSEHLQGGPSHADLSPKPGHDDVFLASSSDRSAKRLVVPRVHARTFDDLLSFKDVKELRPDITRKALRFDSRQNGWNIEKLGHLGQQSYLEKNVSVSLTRGLTYIVHEKRFVNVVDSKRHLGLFSGMRKSLVRWSTDKDMLTHLVIDEDDGSVLRGVEFVVGVCEFHLWR